MCTQLTCQPFQMLDILNLGLQITESLRKLDLNSVSQRCGEMQTLLESWDQALNQQKSACMQEEMQCLIKRQKLEKITISMIGNLGICYGSGAAVSALCLVSLSNPVTAVVAGVAAGTVGIVSGVIAAKEAAKTGDSNIAAARDLLATFQQDRRRACEELDSIQKCLCENKRKIEEAKLEKEQVEEKLSSAVASLEENMHLRQFVAKLKEQLLNQLLNPSLSLNYNQSLQQVVDVTRQCSKIRETKLSLLLSINYDLIDSLTNPEIAVMFDARDRKSIESAQEELRQAKLALQNDCHAIT